MVLAKRRTEGGEALVFVTVAGPAEQWAGQNIYMERPGPRSVLRGAHPGRLAHGAPVVLLADGSPVELEGVRR